MLLRGNMFHMCNKQPRLYLSMLIFVGWCLA